METNIINLFRFWYLLILGTFIVDCKENRGVSVLSAISQPLDEPGDSNTVPSLPVEWQGKSCQLDFNNQLFGGVKEACSSTQINRRRCCPVLEAWLIAARAEVALQAPAPVTPETPLLPDDSMVCIANLEAALESKGLHLRSPNASCDVVTCVCGIRLSDITVTKCPKNVYYTSAPHGSSLTASSQVSITSSNGSFNASGTSHKTNSSPSDLFPALEANCADHTYYGCTKCLTTLEQITRRRHALNKTEGLNCEFVGLMWLLENNKTRYIPTVSAVLRALIYRKHSARGAPRCSSDWDDMPLAADSVRLEQESLAQQLPIMDWSLSYFLSSWLLIFMVIAN